MGDFPLSGLALKLVPAHLRENREGKTLNKPRQKELYSFYDENNMQQFPETTEKLWSTGGLENFTRT